MMSDDIFACTYVHSHQLIMEFIKTSFKHVLYAFISKINVC